MGAKVITVSFEPDTTISGVNGIEIVLDVVTTSSPLPAWWDLRNAGSCRQFALTSDLGSPIGGGCLDWSGGQAAGGIAGYTLDPFFLNRDNVRRIHLATATQTPPAAPLQSGTEYFAMHLNLSNERAVGSGACAGCGDPACILALSLKLATNDLTRDMLLQQPMVAGSNIVTWQGKPAGDCLAVPVHRSSWSQVKALYR